MIDPYFYQNRGQQTLMTSMVVPIFDKQRNFIGVVGIDLNLQRTQTLLNSLKLPEYETAYSTFYSPKGMLLKEPSVNNH